VVTSRDNCGFRQFILWFNIYLSVYDWECESYCYTIFTVFLGFMRKVYMFVDVRNTIDEHCVTEERHGLVMS